MCGNEEAKGTCRYIDDLHGLVYRHPMCVSFALVANMKIPFAFWYLAGARGSGIRDSGWAAGGPNHVVFAAGEGRYAHCILTFLLRKWVPENWRWPQRKRLEPIFSFNIFNDPIYSTSIRLFGKCFTVDSQLQLQVHALCLKMGHTATHFMSFHVIECLLTYCLFRRFDCWNMLEHLNVAPRYWPIYYMLAYYMLPIYRTHCLKNAADPRITTTEVNIARTHNFGVKQRQAAKAGWGQMLGRKNGILYNII